ncbi:hypothetical protein JCM10449v2_007630 [Rhodotorula kratochvilovae]
MQLSAPILALLSTILLVQAAPAPLPEPSPEPVVDRLSIVASNRARFSAMASASYASVASVASAASAAAAEAAIPTRAPAPVAVNRLSIVASNRARFSAAAAASYTSVASAASVASASAAAASKASIVSVRSAIVASNRSRLGAGPPSGFATVTTRPTAAVSTATPTSSTTLRGPNVDFSRWGQQLERFGSAISSINAACATQMTIAYSDCTFDVYRSSTRLRTASTVPTTAPTPKA